MRRRVCINPQIDWILYMVKRKKLLASVAFASLTLSLTFGLLPAYATKMQAKPLPRNGDPAGRSSYSRQSKDFSSASNQTSDYTSNADPDQPLAITRWKRRPDYRDVEKQEAEQKEQKAKDAAQAKAQEEAAKKEHYKKQVELS